MSDLATVRANILACAECGLISSCRSPVPGDYPTPFDSPSDLFLIGEAPGYNEDINKIPFCGAAGKELNRYLLRAGLPFRERIYVSNVIKCRPPDNRDPEWSEIHACYSHLKAELEAVKPRVIGLLGAWAAKAVIDPDFNLAALHGIPLRVRFTWGEAICIAIYHPAAGLHEPSFMARIEDDFEALAKAYRADEEGFEDWGEYPARKEEVDYFEIKNGAGLNFSGCVAIDTETQQRAPWSVQIAVPDMHHSVGLIRAESGYAIGELKRALNAAFEREPDFRVILHNAQFDLPVLSQMGIQIPIERCHDSMIAAYNLQNEPQSLKLLGERYCGIRMKPYAKVVEKATEAASLGYLKEALAAGPYPDPDPIEEFDAKSKKNKIRFPTNIEKRIARILADAATGKEVDVWKRWHNIDEEEGRGMVEEKVGAMRQGYLSEIPFAEALHYACLDADVTLRIWPILWKKIQEEGLEKAYYLDLYSLPLIMEMEKAGIGVDEEKLAALSIDYQDKMNAARRRAEGKAGYEFNPNSSKQVAELLYDKLRIPEPRPKGKTKVKRSTEDDLIKPYEHQYPVVKDILEYRGLLKSKTSYADSFLAAIEDDGRMRFEILTTRTDTGRRATKNPNILSTPKMDEEGRRIRECFVAREGCVFVSADYSQIELRLLAHESGDPDMMWCYIDGKIDLHTRTAARIEADIRGIPVEEAYQYVTKQKRDAAKPVNFGIPYGMTPSGLALKLNAMGVHCTEREAAKWLRAPLDEFPLMEEWLRKKEAEARATGRVRMWSGRYRRVGEIRAVDRIGAAENRFEEREARKVYEAACRYAVNAPIQGGAVDAMKSAEYKVLPVMKKFREEYGAVCDPLLDYHDNLLWEVEGWAALEFAKELKAVMEGAVEWAVPILVDVEVGESWGTMEKIKWD